MQPSTAQQLLPVWESGGGQTPSQRALALLAAAHPESSLESLVGLSIGRRDERLLRLRERVFGPRLAAIGQCPQCETHLEISFAADQLVAKEGDTPPGELSVAIEEYEVHYRLPNSLDLIAMEKVDSKDRNAIMEVLIARCLLLVLHQNREIAPSQLPDNVIATVSRGMADADLQSEVRLALDCPSCRHQWEALFDIVSFFWSEIDAWARRTLREVHVLASAYGWSEEHILTMNPERRAIYLAMLTA